MSFSSDQVDLLNLRDCVVGIDEPTPLLNGGVVSYVNLDNAASTPPLKEVMSELQRFMPYYSSVHRGTGFKSRLSTRAFEQAHEIIGQFVGADLNTNTVIFGKNTTEAINKLSNRYPMTSDSVVISTSLEHHSNDLPWRNKAKVIYVRATPEGRLDIEDFDKKLSQYAGRIALVAVTAASNVTGFLQPIHLLAQKTHDVGAKILVDAAQLAPHRKLVMKPDDDPEHIDFVALSAHKMYAPFGTGALIGPKSAFSEGAPDYVGGGTAEVVTPDEAHWSDLPDKEEAGSPNVVGAVAMAIAAQTLMRVGMDRIAAHEASLTAYCLERLALIPGMEIYGEKDPLKTDERVGVIPFNLEEISHFLLAAVLGYEGGIGVRCGCFCAHPYVVHLLGITPDEAAVWQSQILNGDKSNMPGMVRASFGCYNNESDIDRLIDLLDCAARGMFEGDYSLDPGSGEYIPNGYEEPIADYWDLNGFCSDQQRHEQGR